MTMHDRRRMGFDILSLCASDAYKESTYMISTY